MSLKHYDSEDEARAALTALRDAPRATKTAELKSRAGLFWRMGCLGSFFLGWFPLAGFLLFGAGAAGGDVGLMLLGGVLALTLPAMIYPLARAARKPRKILESGRRDLAKITMSNRGMKLMAPPSIRFTYRVDGKEHADTFTSDKLVVPPPSSFIHVVVDPKDPKSAVPVFDDA